MTLSFFTGEEAILTKIKVEATQAAVPVKEIDEKFNPHKPLALIQS